MPRQGQPRRPLKRARHDRQIDPRSVPEQVRPTGSTEPPPSRIRRLKPGHFPSDFNIFPPRRCRRHMMPAGLAALLTMARNHRPHWPRDAIGHGRAQARASSHLPAHPRHLLRNRSTSPTNRTTIATVVRTALVRLARLAQSTISVVSPSTPPDIIPATAQFSA